MTAPQNENSSDDLEIFQEEQRKLMSEILQKIRHRPKMNPVEFRLPDSTVLLQEDRSR